MKPQIMIGGAHHSVQEYRDVVHDADKVIVVPPVFDAGYDVIPVQMQHQIGICTAEAVCTLIERFRGDGVVLSRTFTYLVGKTLIDGNTSEGSAIKSMLQGAYKYGTQPTSVVPDNITDTTTYVDFIKFDITPYLATATKIPGYISIPTDSASITSAIYTYKGIAVRYDMYPTWWTNTSGVITWDKNQLQPLREGTTITGGHAVVYSKYDFSSTQNVTLRNSWSASWCDNGNAFTYFDQYPCTEAWAISPTPVLPSPLPAPKAFHHTFSIDLQTGETNSEITALQNALSIMGYMDKKYITGYYGPITAGAVFAFQKQYVITNLYTRIVVWTNLGRYCSNLTRQALNKIFS